MRKAKYTGAIVETTSVDSRKSDDVRINLFENRRYCDYLDRFDILYVCYDLLCCDRKFSL